MKNQIKALLILSSLIWAFASVSCNNELKENPTYYTVSFDSDGGSFVAAQTVESGKTAVEPRSPTKSGYTFDDWYKDSSVFDFLTPITSNLTLKAKWTKIQNKENPTYYTVSFDSDGGSFVAAQTVESGKTAVEPRSPTKSGYTFDDWYKDSSVFDFLTPITSNLTLKAKWTKIQNNDSQNDNNTEENGNENKTDETPSAEVSGLTVTENHKRIILNWINPADEDFASVEITCEPAEGSLSEPQKIQGNPTEEKSYTIYNLENGKEYKITIKTIDSSNNKSTGVTKTASPKESKINLEVSLPNDDGENIILTNDKATINVTISPTDQVVKAVWKKGGSAGMSDGDALLSDDSATVLVFNSNTASFTVTENGYYDIAVRNSEGVTECIRTEIKTIDKTPLAEVTNLTSESDGQNIYVSWDNPLPQNKYDSPLKTVILSYVYNDDENDAANGEITLNAGEEQTTIPIAVEKTDEDFVRITVKVVDELGNVSQGYKIQEYCDGCVHATSADVYEKIINITKNKKIIISGNCNLSTIADATKKLIEEKPDIRISLDLSKVSGITTFEGFGECYNIREIIIPNTTKSIGSRALDRCSNLTKVIIPSGVTNIGELAFASCSGLEEITIPETVVTIGEQAFCGCEKITSLCIPDSVTNIQKYALGKCINLKNLTIPGTIDIDYNVFSAPGGGSGVYITTIYISGERLKSYFFNCFSYVTDIIILDSVKIIEDNAFPSGGSYNEIKNITIGKGITNIGDYTFAGCSKLENINLPEGIVSIGSYAFKSCSNLTRIEIPSSVTNIDEYAFYGCTGLTNIIISKNVISIGQAAFSGCSALEEITLPFIGGSKNETEPSNKLLFGYIFGYDYYADNNKFIQVQQRFNVNSNYNCTLPKVLKKVTFTGESIPYGAFSNCINLTEIALENEITNIRDYSFYGCTELTDITIPETVTTIGASAFEKCSNIENINIPNSVTSIGASAFSGCSNLKSISLSESITSIENSLFFDCKKLTEISIPENVVSIGSSAFCSCIELTSINIPNKVTNIESGTFFCCRKLFDIHLSNSLTKIGSQAFQYCEGLANISIPQTVTQIEDCAFKDCVNLESISIPASVETIGYSAFENCTKLATVTFADSSLCIGNSAFRNCSSLTSVYIPDNVTFVPSSKSNLISGSPFLGCENITEITIPKCVMDAGVRYIFYSSKTKITDVVLLNSVNAIEESSFEGFTALANISIPNTVETIGNYAFKNCQNLSTITIPDSVTYIGSAFYGCSNLKNVILSNKLTEIGASAFYNCKKILSITIPATVVEIGSSAFYGCTGISKITIPDAVKDIGKSAFVNCTNLKNVTFENTTDGWYKDDCNGTVIGIGAMSSNTSKNAGLLKQDYRYYSY